MSDKAFRRLGWLFQGIFLAGAIFCLVLTITLISSGLYALLPATLSVLYIFNIFIVRRDVKRLTTNPIDIEEEPCAGWYYDEQGNVVCPECETIDPDTGKSIESGGAVVTPDEAVQWIAEARIARTVQRFGSGARDLIEENHYRDAKREAAEWWPLVAEAGQRGRELAAQAIEAAPRPEGQEGYPRVNAWVRGAEAALDRAACLARGKPKSES